VYNCGEPTGNADHVCDRCREELEAGSLGLRHSVTFYRVVVIGALAAIVAIYVYLV
jgi:hypothetical protein